MLTSPAWRLRTRHWTIYDLAAELRPLALEKAAAIDGHAFHASRREFERDRQRDADLAARGIRVMRVTWKRLTRQPQAVLVTLGGALLATPGGRS